MRIDIRPPSTAQLSNFKATPGVLIVNLTWNVPTTDPSYRAAQVWVNEVNDFESAKLFNTVSSNFIDYSTTDEKVRYFWIRAVNEFGRADGAVTGPVSAKASLVTTGNIGVFDLATANIINQLKVANITGLGALATLNQVNANTQVTNLGGLAFADQLAANQIGAGTLAAGVVYAGTINAGQINAGTLKSGVVYAGRINADQVTAGTFYGSSISGGNYTSYAWPTGSTARGFYLGPEGLKLGSTSSGRYFNVDQFGDMWAPGFTLVNGRLTLNAPTITGLELESFSAFMGGGVGGSYPNGTSGYGYLTANPSGGKAPYRYSWLLSMGMTTGNAGGINIESPSSKSCGFYGSGVNATMEATVTCIVTDANQRSITLVSSISINHGTPI